MKKAVWKICSLIMSFAMVLGIIPISAYVAYAETTTAKTVTTYELNTDEVSEDAEYMIVSNGKALKNNNGKVSDIEVTVENNKVSVENTEGVLWKFKKTSKGYTAQNGNKYLSVNANKKGISVTLGRSKDFNLTDKQNGNYVISKENSGRYAYLAYNEGFIANNEEATVQLYKVVTSIDEEDTIASEDTTEEATVKEEATEENNKEVAKESNISLLADNYYYFPVTLYDYDTDDINNATKKLENGKQGLYFNSGGAQFGSESSWNKWTGHLSNNKNSVYTGLVESSLDNNGNIVFTVPQADIFKAETGSGKQYYTNVQLPFTLDNKGYYTYDSENGYDVRFPGEIASDQTLEPINRQFNRDSGLGVGRGFFPFNKEDSNKSKETTPDYHFGMVMSTNFYTTSSGQVNNEDMIFEFTGDDDVWVFVDGKLVLDLGGIHNAVTGKINFAKGTIECTAQSLGTGSANRGGNLYSILGNKNDFLNSEETHTLQVFYLERGQGASNCKIKFNLPRKDTLEITKNLDNDTLKSKDADRLKNTEYTFTVKSTTGVLSNKPYTVYNSNNTKIGSGTTDKNGKLNLKYGQTARFFNFNGGLYTVTEEENSEYKASWKTGITNLLEGNTYNIEAKGYGITYRFICTNTYKPQLENDVVVIDFGKTLGIDILANDKLYGKDKVQLNTKNLSEGRATYDSESKNVKYTPTKFMDKIDVATYSVEGYDGEASVTVIPGTSVYYEDNFNNAAGKSVITYGNGWTTGGDNTITEIKGDNPIGYDTNYSNAELQYSGGTVHYVKAASAATKADFTFKGTGIDIYALTKGEQGRVLVRIYKQKSDGTYSTVAKDAVFSKIIETKYNSGQAYQVPVINFKSDDKTPTNYKVELTVGKGSTFYLDALRIYNPIGNTNDAYGEESGSEYISIREQSLNDTLFTVSGDVFIDAYLGNKAQVINLSKDISDEDLNIYTTYGRKTEVVIAPDDSVTLTLKNNATFTQLGARIDAKSPLLGGSSSGKVLVNGKDIDLTSSTDMYYEVTPDNNKITITNNTNKLVALTNLKLK